MHTRKAAAPLSTRPFRPLPAAREPGARELESESTCRRCEPQPQIARPLAATGSIFSANFSFRCPAASDIPHPEPGARQKACFAFFARCGAGLIVLRAQQQQQQHAPQTSAQVARKAVRIHNAPRKWTRTAVYIRRRRAVCHVDVRGASECIILPVIRRRRGRGSASRPVAPRLAGHRYEYTTSESDGAGCVSGWREDARGGSSKYSEFNTPSGCGPSARSVENRAPSRDSHT
ncbi:hypothetical protein C2E23DRAFT_82976 [Lenzites betulinus]|nr:hypothetical protein C2E23DRAFT_82976 [Lenzites betulinus]